MYRAGERFSPKQRVELIGDLRGSSRPCGRPCEGSDGLPHVPARNAPACPKFRASGGHPRHPHRPRFRTRGRQCAISDIKMVEHWYEDMLAHDEEQFSGVRGTWNRIRFIVHHHLASIRREPALSRLVFQELRPDPDYRKTRLFQLNQAYTHRLVEVVKAAMAAGEFKMDISASLVRDMIYGAVERRTWSFLRNEGDFNLEETADGITEIITRASRSPRRERLSSRRRRDSRMLPSDSRLWPPPIPSGGRGPDGGCAGAPPSSVSRGDGICVAARRMGNRTSSRDRVITF